MGSGSRTAVPLLPPPPSLLPPPPLPPRLAAALAPASRLSPSLGPLLARLATPPDGPAPASLPVGAPRSPRGRQAPIGSGGGGGASVESERPSITTIAMTSAALLSSSGKGSECTNPGGAVQPSNAGGSPHDSDVFQRLLARLAVPCLDEIPSPLACPSHHQQLLQLAADPVPRRALAGRSSGASADRCTAALPKAPDSTRSLYQLAQRHRVQARLPQQLVQLPLSSQQRLLVFPSLPDVTPGSTSKSGISGDSAIGTAEPSELASDTASAPSYTSNSPSDVASARPSGDGVEAGDTNSPVRSKDSGDGDRGNEMSTKVAAEKAAVTPADSPASTSQAKAGGACVPPRWAMSRVEWAGRLFAELLGLGTAWTVPCTGCGSLSFFVPLVLWGVGRDPRCGARTARWRVHTCTRGRSQRNGSGASNQHLIACRPQPPRSAVADPGFGTRCRTASHCGHP